MIANYDNNNTTTGKIEISDLPEWIVGASGLAPTEPFSIVVRVWRASEAGSNQFRNPIALAKTGSNSDGFGIRYSDTIFSARAGWDQSGTPENALLKDSAGGNPLPPGDDEWVWMCIAVDPTGTNLVLSAFYCGEETRTDATDLDNECSLAGAGATAPVSEIDWNNLTLWLFNNDSSLISGTGFGGYIDTVTIFKNTMLTPTDLNALRADGTRFPFKMTSGNFSGAEYLFIPLSPVTNPTPRGGGAGTSAAQMGDLVESADDVCIFHAFTGATDEGVIQRYDINTEKTGAGELYFVNPYESEVYGTDPTTMTRDADTPELPTNGSGDSVVDVGNFVAPSIGDYVVNGTAPDRAIEFLHGANSRGVGYPNDAGNRTFGRAWSNGWVVPLWAEICGWCTPIGDYSARKPIFDQPQGVLNTATAWKDVVTDAGWRDFSRFGAGAYTSGGIGPGGGLAINESSANVLQLVIRELSANTVPELTDDLFAAGGEYAGSVTYPEGDTKFIAEAEVDYTLLYLKGPNFGTLQWQFHTLASGANSNDAGTLVTGDDARSGAIDMATTASFTQAWTANDTYTAGTNTLSFDTPNVSINDTIERDGTTRGSLCVVTGASGEVRGLAEVVSQTGGTVVLAHPLESAPQTGDTVTIGPWELAVETIRLPAINPASIDYRALQFAPGGMHYLIANRAIAVGATGFVPGDFGWSGNGYGNQLDEWAYPGILGEIASLFDVDGILLSVAEQGSATSDMISTLPGQILSYAPGTDIVLCSDTMNADDDTAAATYSTAIMGQAVYPAASIYRDANAYGDMWSKVTGGLQDNEPHPNWAGMTIFCNALAQHFETMTLVLPPNPSTGPKIAPFVGAPVVQGPVALGGIADRGIVRP